MLTVHSILLFKEYNETTQKYLPTILLHDYLPESKYQIPHDVNQQYDLKSYFEDIDRFLTESGRHLEDIHPKSLFALRWYPLPSEYSLDNRGRILDENTGYLTHTAEPLWLSFDDCSNGDLRFLASAGTVQETLNQEFPPRYRLYVDNQETGEVSLVTEFTDSDFTKDDLDTKVKLTLDTPEYRNITGIAEVCICNEYPTSVVLFTEDGTPIHGRGIYWNKDIGNKTPFEYATDNFIYGLNYGVNPIIKQADQ